MQNSIDGNEKREEIINASAELFFERGYEKTSVHMIQKKAGNDAGLFYYYFGGKEEVFREVLERFFATHRRKLQKIIEDGKRDPFRVMNVFFEYIKNEAENFKKNYSEKMNERIKLEFRARTLRALEFYLKKIFNILAEYGEKPLVNSDVVAIALANGIGNIILSEKNFSSETRKIEFKSYISMIMGFYFKNAETMFSFFAENSDVNSIMELAYEVKDDFGGFDDDVFRQNIIDKISKNEILVIRNENVVVGCLAFSREKPEIEFLATLKDYRRLGIASKLIITAMAQYLPGTEVSVITYLESDDKGKEALGLYKKFGFQNCGDIVAFGQKRQCMTAVVGNFN